MKRNYSFLFIFVLIVFSFYSCTNPATSPGGKNTTNPLIGTSWQYENEDGDAVIVHFSSASAGEKYEFVGSAGYIIHPSYIGRSPAGSVNALPSQYNEIRHYVISYRYNAELKKASILDTNDIETETFSHAGSTLEYNPDPSNPGQQAISCDSVGTNVITSLAEDIQTISEDMDILEDDSEGINAVY